jgi:hypothetical protein
VSDQGDDGAGEGPLAPVPDGAYGGALANRIMLGAGIALGLVATVLVVLGGSPRLMRLGVLAALWAALLAGFLAARYRREVAARHAELGRLDAGPASRAEPAPARDHAEPSGRDAAELAALRAEVTELRRSVDELVSGDVLVERIGMLAETTRMRRIADPAPAVGQQNGQPARNDHHAELPPGDPDGSRAGRHGSRETREDAAGAHTSGVSVPALLGRSENTRHSGHHRAQ